MADGNQQPREIIAAFAEELVREFNARANAYQAALADPMPSNEREAVVDRYSVLREIANGIAAAAKRVK